MYTPRRRGDFLSPLLFRRKSLHRFAIRLFPLSVSSLPNRYCGWGGRGKRYNFIFIISPNEVYYPPPIKKITITPLPPSEAQKCVFFVYIMYLQYIIYMIKTYKIPSEARDFVSFLKLRLEKENFLLSPLSLSHILHRERGVTSFSRRKAELR